MHKILYNSNPAEVGSQHCGITFIIQEKPRFVKSEAYLFF